MSRRTARQSGRNAACPVAQTLNDAVGIENNLMTTVHAHTNDQNLSDVYRQDPYRVRSATHSMIPTRTAAAAVGPVLPAATMARRFGWASSHADIPGAWTPHR